MSIARIRILLVGFVAFVVAVAAGDIFDTAVPEVLPAAVLPVVVAFVLANRRFAVRAIAAIATVIVALGATVALAGGTPGDALDAVTSGLQRTLSTDWPSPDRPDLVGMVGAAIATATAVAAELAGRRRWHLLPLVPLVVVHVAVVALSAPIGVRLRWVLPIGIAAIVLATLRPDTGDGEQFVLLRGERRVIPLAAIAVVVAGAMSLPLELEPRADPRRNDPPEQTAPLLDPIEATLALRALDPPVVLHEVRSTSDEVLPDRWRTAALENYDGERWTPELTLRPIGRRLGPEGPDAVDVTVRFFDDDLVLVPLPGSPVTVDAAIETDAERTIVRLADRPDPDEEIAVTANVAPVVPADAPAQLATRPVDETVSGLSEFAEALAGDGTVLERLRSIEATMRSTFVLDSDVPGGGVQRALVDRFLRETERGNEEQFATAFVLLARSIGVDARVATGFVVEPDDVGAVSPLRSSAARIWPEVRLLDGGWVSFDPVPTEEAGNVVEPPPEPEVQTPAAPQPPIVPPPEPSNETPLDDVSDEDDANDPLGTAVVWVFRAAALVGLVTLPVLLAIAVILGVKHRRRRRRLQAPTPTARIRGAWAVATDSLVDAGLSIDASSTDGEIAADAEPMAPTAVDELHRLASLSSAATFGSPTRPEDLAHDASVCLDQVESSVGSSLTRWQRMRWRLSSRSLRGSTRSPVDV